MERIVRNKISVNFLNKTPWPGRILRLVLGALFIYVGYSRLQHPNLVAEHMLNLKIIPWGIVNFFAMWMLIFEVFIGLLVISGIWLRACSVVLIGFCLLCTFLISYALVNDLSMHCGCFVASATGKPRNWGSLYQEGIMLLGCILLFFTTGNGKLKT